MYKLSIPVLQVSSAAGAEAYYCGKLGFARRFAYRVDEARDDPCYMGVEREGVWLHLSSFPGDGPRGGGVYVIVEDADAVHAELVSRGVEIRFGPGDQDWGNREVHVTDPDGNRICFAQEGVV